MSLKVSEQNEYGFWVVGTSPLLTNNPANSLGGSSSAGRAKDPNPEEQAEKSTYRDGEGHFVFPAIAFRNSLIGKGGVASSYKVKGRKTAKAFLSHMQVSEEFVILRDPDTGAPLTEYAIDKRRAVVQGQGIIRARPRFERWACEVGLLVRPAVFYREEEGQDVTGDYIATLLNDAGRTLGVGDYRPQKTGWFGMFRVEIFER